MRVLAIVATAGAVGLLSFGGIAAVAQQSEDRAGPRAERGDDDRGNPRRGRGSRGERELTKDDFLERARSRFARFDVNSDGEIDRSEIERRIERRMTRRGRRGVRRMERRIRRLDADRNGSVSNEEFVSRMLDRMSRRDLNGDGQISDADLPPRLRGREVLKPTSTFEPRRRRASRRLNRMRMANTNGDNVISQEEITAAANARFARLDRNGDGSIDKADISALTDERRDFRVQRFLARFGAQTSGTVTRKAFMTQASERFERRDANGDGVLTRDEMRTKRGGRGRGYRRDRMKSYDRI